MNRCFGDGDPLYERYHDEEWGRPQTSEQALYEKVCLEGFQAGLAWITVLRKREALREVFAGFDPERVAELDVEPLLDDARLIRSGPKLRACVTNARATLALREHGGLPALLWSAAEVPSPAPSAVGGRAGVHPGQRGAGEAAQAGRLRLRRTDDGLLAAAGVRAGRRPPHHAARCATRSSSCGRR